jgi:hypothetical protein
MKGLIGVGAGIVLLGAVRLGARPLLVALAGAAAPIAVTFALVALTPSASSYNASATTGLSPVYGHAAPRLALFRSAQHLASTNFPVGAGLATFGSYLDKPREVATFGELSGSGLRPPAAFVSDNYVAHILAERGYAGLLAWLLSISAFLWCALVAPRRFGLFPAVVLAASIAMSPVLPVFRDGTEVILLFVPVGMYLWAASEQFAGRAK